MKRTYDAMVRKVGNSYVITIAKSVLKKLRLKKGSMVEVTIKK